MRILNLPLPVLAAVLVPQIEPPEAVGPGYVAAAFGGAWLVLWYLQQIGKLPGAGGASDRRENVFKDSDRTMLAEVHKTVTREDSEKPGWPMVWNSGREAREVRDAVQRLAGLADVWIEDREEWKRERAELQMRVTRLEEVNRQQEHALQSRGTGA